MIIGPLFLLGLFSYPLWNIMLGAPQYPEPLGMNIHIDGLRDMNEFDLQNIDGLNHYITKPINMNIHTQRFWVLWRTQHNVP